MQTSDNHTKAVLPAHRPSPTRAVAQASAVVCSTADGWRRIAFLVVGGLFLWLGVLGAFLPGLPATPFLLLTSYFLVRSSPRLNDKLLQSRVFGPILIDWQVHGGVRLHVKIKATITVLLTVALTIFLSSYSLRPSLAVVTLASVGIAVIVRLPSPKTLPGQAKGAR